MWEQVSAYLIDGNDKEQSEFIYFFFSKAGTFEMKRPFFLNNLTVSMKGGLLGSIYINLASLEFEVRNIIKFQTLTGLTVINMVWYCYKQESNIELNEVKNSSLKTCIINNWYFVRIT